MNCPFCQEPLKPDQFDTWNISGRRMVSYNCRNPRCTIAHYVSGSTNMTNFLSDKINVEVVFPDNEVIAYTFIFTMNNQWYRIFCHSGAPSKQTTKPTTVFFAYKDQLKTFSSGFEQKDVILAMERFIPMDWNKPIEDQIELVKNKLQTLLPFL